MSKSGLFEVNSFYRDFIQRKDIIFLGRVFGRIKSLLTLGDY